MTIGSDVVHWESGNESVCADCTHQNRCPFVGLPYELHARYLEMRQPRFYARGTTVVERGHKLAGIYLICSGRVRLYRLDAEGHASTVGLLGPGDLIGVRELMLGHPHQFTAETMSSGKIFYLPRRDFVPFLTDEHAVALEVLVKISEEVYEWSERLWNEQRMDTSNRLLRTLIVLAEGDGSPVPHGLRLDLPLTVSELAESIGCSRQWTSRMLKELETDGLIHRRRGIIVLTPAAFEAARCEGDAC